MKKIILALATLLFMGSAATKAQVTKVTVRSISGNSKEEVENIDNAKYRITYEGKWVNNPSIKPFIYKDSEMRLDIGEKAASFYDNETDKGFTHERKSQDWQFRLLRFT